MWDSTMYDKVVTHGETSKLDYEKPMVVVGRLTIYKPINLNIFFFYFLRNVEREDSVS